MKPNVASIGAINWDISLYVPKIAGPGEEVVVKRIERIPGGKAANVAVAVARLLGRWKCAIVGGVGDDEIGRAHKEIFEKEGVVTDYLFVFKNVQSGQAYILIDERGENQINTYFGANAELKEEHAEMVRELIENLEFLVIMDPPIPFTRKIMEYARDKVPILWAPGVRTLRDKEAVISLLSHIDYFVLNEHELVNLLNVSNTSLASQKLIGRFPKLKLIVTLGERGSMLASKDKEIAKEGIKLDKLGLKAVNTVGCGDAFIGAFASYMVLTSDEVKALEMANYAGAYKATKYETRGSPSRKELELFKKSYIKALA